MIGFSDLAGACRPAAVGVFLLLLAACGSGAASPAVSSSPAVGSSVAGVSSPSTAAPASAPSSPSAAVAGGSAGAKPAGSPAAKPAGASGPSDPCSLITKDEAEAALGLKFDHTSVARGGSALGGHGADCNYEGALPLDPSFTVHTLTGADFQADRSIPISQWVSVSKNSKSVQPVAGVGDAAFWNPSLQVLDLTKGNFWMELLATDTKKQYQFKLDSATALAQKAVSRL
jgi:hypothetical protein